MTFETLLAVLFFSILFVSGVFVFGEAAGGTARGAAVPLLFIPLISDWTRFLGRVSHGAGFAVGTGAYLVLAALFLMFRRRHFSSPSVTWDKRWLVALMLFIVANVVIRTWLFTGSVPNPGDDTFGGYKANALLHSSWPTIHPEVPELPMSYYYHAYTWPAGLADWGGINLKAGWWVTAIALCAVGGMLVFEIIVPRLNDRRTFLLAWAAVLNGCALSILLAAVTKVPPKYWHQEVGYLTAHFGLYMRVPQQFGAYWMPFGIFATGVLLASVVILVEFMQEGWEFRKAGFATLGIASLTGYCTFHLIGFMMVVLPVLCVAAVLVQKRAVFAKWLVHLSAVGAGAVLLSLPLILDLAQRKTGIRYGRFRDPLLVWLQTAFDKFSVLQICGLFCWALLAALAGNILILPVLLRPRSEKLSLLASVLLGVFFLGSFLSFFGVMDDFVPKFGHFISTALVVLFFLLNERPKWSYALLLAGLVGPTLFVLNNVRANVAQRKWDPVWHELDRVTEKTGEVVLYDVSVTERRTNRTPWENILPLYSKASFLIPADQVDEQDQNFLRDPADLEKLPPIEVRLAKLMGNAPSYLLLTTPDQPPLGEELYRSELFTLQRVPRPLTVAPKP